MFSAPADICLLTLATVRNNLTKIVMTSGGASELLLHGSTGSARLAARLVFLTD